MSKKRKISDEKAALELAYAVRTLNNAARALGYEGRVELGFDSRRRVLMDVHIISHVPEKIMTPWPEGTFCDGRGIA